MKYVAIIGKTGNGYAADLPDFTRPSSPPERPLRKPDSLSRRRPISTWKVWQRTANPSLEPTYAAVEFESPNPCQTRRSPCQDQRMIDTSTLRYVTLKMADHPRTAKRRHRGGAATVGHPAGGGGGGGQPGAGGAAAAEYPEAGVLGQAGAARHQRRAGVGAAGAHPGGAGGGLMLK